MPSMQSTYAVTYASTIRVTVLGPDVLRLEHHPQGHFVDANTLVIENRSPLEAAFTVEETPQCLRITTEVLQLDYTGRGADFSPNNTVITWQAHNLKGTWQPGQTNNGLLPGTRSTLDNLKALEHYETRQQAALEPGLISTEGYTVIDDSHTPLLTHDQMPWPMARPQGGTDWYFFAYGYNYKLMLGNYVRLAGAVALPPLFALGYWWSRYWAYSEREIRQLAQTMQSHQIPLDVMVIDMDWHTTENLSVHPEKSTDPFEQRIGWTGYTWNRDLFPQPEKLLSWLHQNGIRATLNLHPASGVAPTEQQYHAFAKLCPPNPDKQNYIPYAPLNPKFSWGYRHLLLQPLEQQGVDFWWLDWQQWPQTEITGLNNTWWLNHLHTWHMRLKEQRPLLFHRWGGLGNHRYPIGFSGDVIIAWESLQYQPEFTANASNVGYGWWSHDIGGHFYRGIQNPVFDPELYLRWLQLGVFSPIFRTHGGKDPMIERRVWAFEAQWQAPMRKAIYDRYSWVPYIYQQGFSTWQTGVGLVRPLYYEHPKAPQAYQNNNTFYFGSDVLVNPITTPTDANGLAHQQFWLPPGQWFDTRKGSLVNGDVDYKTATTITEQGCFVKPGALIAKWPNVPHNTTEALHAGHFVIERYPGKAGKGFIFIDDQATEGYTKGQYQLHEFTYQNNNLHETITLNQTEGHNNPQIPEIKQLTIRLLNTCLPNRILINGREQPEHCTVRFNTEVWATEIILPTYLVKPGFELTLHYPHSTEHIWQVFGGFTGRINRFYQVLDAIKTEWGRVEMAPLPAVINRLDQTAMRCQYQTNNVLAEIDKAQTMFDQLPSALHSMVPVAEAKAIEKCLALLQNF